MGGAITFLAILTTGCAVFGGVAKGMPVTAEEKSDKTDVTLRSAGEKSTPAVTVVPSAEAFVPDLLRYRREYEFVDFTEGIFQQPVTATFVETGLEDVVLDLARKLELNIVINPVTSKGRVTLEVHETPAGDAFRAVLFPHDLKMIRFPGHVFSIIPTPPPPATKAITVHIPLKHVPARGMKEVLQGFYDKSIAVDPFNNALVITDEPLRIEELANAIMRIDRAPKRWWHLFLGHAEEPEER
jgi:hypothetical protein